jgi:hypothetical protein
MKKDAAQQNLAPIETTVEEIEKVLASSELDWGGQIMSDFLRLYSPSEDGIKTILVNGEELKVLFRMDTKFIGVVPKGLKTDKLEAKLLRAGYNFEIISVDVTVDQLTEMVDAVDLAFPLAKL